VTQTSALAKVHSLANMVAYQEGAIVSRTLINKTTGTVTLFAFDAGQSLTEHTSPYDALVYILDGGADITVDGEVCRVHSGESLLLPANHPHALRASERFKMLLIMIR